jgi:hypothetical protein
VTEIEWLNSADTDQMLAFLHTSERVSERKGRLFAVACCRRVWHLLVHEVSREAVEVGERFADGLASDGERYDAYEATNDVWELTVGIHPDAAAEAAEAPLAAVEEAPSEFRADIPAAFAVGWVNATNDLPDPSAVADERMAQADLLRCIVGPLPFRSLPPLPASLLDWQDGLILRMTNAIYEERMLPSGHLDSERLLVLADALEEAGCTDADLLGHLRRSGPHFRGCWAIDWLAGRE